MRRGEGAAVKVPKFRPHQLVMHVDTQFVYRIVDWPRRLQIGPADERGYTYCRADGDDITLHAVTQDAMEGGAFVAWHHSMSNQYPFAVAPSSLVSQEKLTDRIMAAIERVTSGHGQMRVPVDMTDPDIVLAECLTSMSVLESDALCDVIAERQRQINVEGWSASHDDSHTDGGLSRAAACYAHLAGTAISLGFKPPVPPRHYAVSPLPTSLWPWHRRWWNPKDPRRDLVRAGALILAEIERLDRLTARHERAADHPVASTPVVHLGESNA